MEKEVIYTLEELKEKLTKKQSIFCHEYVIDWNGTRAAIVAGYSENSASEMSYENLRKPQIKQYIAFIKNDIEGEAGISKLRVLKGLADIAFGATLDAADTSNQIKALQEIKKAMGYDAEKVHSLTLKSDLTDEDRDEIIKSLKNE